MRFDGFSESWEPRCLKELVVSFDYGLNAPAKPFDFTNKYLRIKDIDEDSRSFSTADLTSPDSELASCFATIVANGVLPVLFESFRQ